MTSSNVPALCVSLAMLLQHTQALLLQRRLLEYPTQPLEHQTQPLRSQNYLICTFNPFQVMDKNRISKGYYKGK